MKKNCILLAVLAVAAGLPFTSCGDSQSLTILKGKLNNYPGHGYLFMHKGGHEFDTIPVQPDGTFIDTLDIKENVEKRLFLNYLGDSMSVISCYMIPGKTLDVQVSGGMQDEIFMGEKTRRYISTATFTGEGQKESEYLNLPPFYNYKYQKEDGTSVTYKEYLQQITERQNFLREKLNGTCEEFAAAAKKEIDAIPEQMAFAFARWSEHFGYDASKDADFMNYVNSIDLNDTINIQKNSSEVVLFKLSMYPDLYKDEPARARFYCYLRDSISNPVVKEQLADAAMAMTMSMGDNEGLVRSFEIYKGLSGKSELYKANEAIYNSLSKLLPGVKASDFEMQDVDGKTVHFLDVIGQGKVTYIDFWATWCGPCCMEIPYVAKLVEKYKNNPNIEFISISLDDNLKKWHEKLKKDKPAWKQYVIPDNFNSSFAKEYNISAIPRFMCFDKEGKIININETRPSDPEIETILNNYIK